MKPLVDDEGKPSADYIPMWRGRDNDNRIPGLESGPDVPSEAIQKEFVIRIELILVASGALHFSR